MGKLCGKLGDEAHPVISLTNLIISILGGVQIKQEIDDDDSLMHTDREDHDYMTPLQNIKKEFNNGSDDSDGSDYHGSDSGELDQENPIMKRNRQRMNRIVAADQQQQRKTNPSAGNITSGDGTQVFIKTLLHALECK